MEPGGEGGGPITRGMDLTPKQRQYLKGLAHPLKPTAQVGNAGVSTAVLAKVSEELKIHELIKVKVADGPVPTKEAAALLAAGCSAGLVQVIGRTIVLYRPRAEEPTIVLPRPPAP